MCRPDVRVGWHGKTWWLPAAYVSLVAMVGCTSRRGPSAGGVGSALTVCPARLRRNSGMQLRLRGGWNGRGLDERELAAHGDPLMSLLAGGDPVSPTGGNEGAVRLLAPSTGATRPMRMKLRVAMAGGKTRPREVLEPTVEDLLFNVKGEGKKKYRSRHAREQALAAKNSVHRDLSAVAQGTYRRGRSVEGRSGAVGLITAPHASFEAGAGSGDVAERISGQNSSFRSRRPGSVAGNHSIVYHPHRLPNLDKMGEEAEHLRHEIKNAVSVRARDDKDGGNAPMEVVRNDREEIDKSARSMAQGRQDRDKMMAVDPAEAGRRQEQLDQLAAQRAGTCALPIPCLYLEPLDGAQACPIRTMSVTTVRVRGVESGRFWGYTACRRCLNT